MASRFWVGGGSNSNWAATVPTNWGTASGTGGGASVPGTSDIAIFDSNSGVANSIIAGNITVQGLECDGSTLGTGAYAGTITHNSGVTLTLNTGAANTLRFSAGMTYTPAAASSIIALTHTSGTANIKAYSKPIAALTINGAGGTTKPLDVLLINAVQSSILTVTSGILDFNSGSGGPFAVTAILFVGTGSTTRSVILGGDVTIGGNAAVNTTVWSFATLTLLTFTKNSANIIILAPTTAFAGLGWTFAGGGQTYNGLTINQSSYGNQLQITGSNTFSTLSIGAGWSLTLAASGTTTIGSAFTFTGTQARPICFITNGINQIHQLSCASGACTLTWGSLLGITGVSGATFTATNTLDLGGNTGWSITPPGDSSSTGVAAAVWQDATAGDFTVSGSIGKSLFTSGVVPGAAGGLFIAGTNAATSVTTALTANVTGNITGNLSGSVGSVTGAVGSVAGNVVGSVGSVTARVTANTDQIDGSATGATNLSKTTLAIGRGTVGSGSTTTSVVTSAYSISGKSGPRAILFDPATTTTNLQGQAVAITASTGGATPTFTVATLTDAPVSGDTFSVV